MADKPVGEVVAVDAVLDALSSPTSSDVYEALDAYSDSAVAAVAAKRAAAGGGGGLPNGWTQDGSTPANVDSNNGALDLGGGGLQAGDATLGVASVTAGVLALLDGGVSGVVIVPLSVDPTAGGGVARPVGSLGLRLSPAQLWHKTGAAATDWTQVAGNPSGFFVQDSDPGAVGSGALWVDTTGDANVTKMRNPANDTWDAVSVLALDAGTGQISAGAYHFPPYSGGFTIENDGSKINVDTPLDLQGLQLLAVDSFVMDTTPEVPALPTEQDIVDALVTLGLVTQAAP